MHQLPSARRWPVIWLQPSPPAASGDGGIRPSLARARAQHLKAKMRGKISKLAVRLRRRFDPDACAASLFPAPTMSIQPPPSELDTNLLIEEKKRPDAFPD